MTSWTKRIKYVGRAIYRFLTTQTIKPDLFYLWLAEAEFPNKEKDLPEDLILICKKFNIQINWTVDNEYCHKRWYVYPKHYEDLVISIDDDVFYDKNLIKQAINYSNNLHNCIINCGDYLYPILDYTNGIQRTFHNAIPDKPCHKILLCGQCIVLPKSFPLEAISPENIILRKKYCKKCDECWLTPFIFNSNTNIMAHKWNNIVNNNIQNTATWKQIIKTKYIQIYLALRCNSDNLINWKKIYPKFNDKNYSNKTKDEILKLLV